MLANMFLFWVIDNLTLSQPCNIAWTDPPPLIILLTISKYSCSYFCSQYFPALVPVASFYTYY